MKVLHLDIDRIFYQITQVVDQIRVESGKEINCQWDVLAVSFEENNQFILQVRTVREEDGQVLTMEKVFSTLEIHEAADAIFRVQEDFTWPPAE